MPHGPRFAVLFGMVFFLTRRFRARRALRLAGSVNGGGPAGGPQMPLAHHLSERGLGGGAVLAQPCTVVVQPDMSVSLCVKDDSSLKHAEEAGAAAPMQREGGGSSDGAARHEVGECRGAELAGQPQAAAAGAAAAGLASTSASAALAAAIGSPAATEAEAAEGMAHASVVPPPVTSPGGPQAAQPAQRAGCSRASAMSMQAASPGSLMLNYSGRIQSAANQCLSSGSQAALRSHTASQLPSPTAQTLLRNAADVSLDFSLLSSRADDLSETSSEADTPPPRVFATPWAPAWTPFWYVAGQQRRRRQRWAHAPSVQGPPAPLEVVDVRHMTEP